VYEDDDRDDIPVNATATYSEFDGLGNYRRRVTGGTFDAGNVRTEFIELQS
jgi:hypothetical protein